MMDTIQLHDICKTFDQHPVFTNWNHNFETGMVHVLKGPSGCGKTTLLRMLMGLEIPDSGTITPLQNYRKATVFQEDRLCENLSAMQNVLMVVRNQSKKDLLDQLKQDFSQVGLDDMFQKVSTLSGGMKRRVAILRAMYAKADILFFDEPLKGLDDITKEKVMRFIKERIKDKTVFWVTHDADEYTVFDKYQLHEL
ncbi:MAG: ATP-binding cassette domain-containing protein [Solobacterium sp.]|nr:ATP-binding cassette domain-containing protein [Solobacterium sp.]